MPQRGKPGWITLPQGRRWWTGSEYRLLPDAGTVAGQAQRKAGEVFGGIGQFFSGLMGGGQPPAARPSAPPAAPRRQGSTKTTAPATRTPSSAQLQGKVNVVEKYWQRVAPRNPAQEAAYSLLRAGVSAATAVRPYVAGAVRSSPAPVRQGLSAGLNQTPFPVNLFGRYYTGLGPEGLQVPESIRDRLRSEASKVAANLPQEIRRAEGFARSARQSRDNAETPGMRSFMNDVAAEAASSVRRMKAGEVPLALNMAGSRGGVDDPSAGLSVGSAWVKVDAQGRPIGTRDRYDFVYANEDAQQTPRPASVPLPSDQLLDKAARWVGGKDQKPGEVPAVAADIGRAVVMGLPPDAEYEYVIDLRQPTRR